MKHCFSMLSIVFNLKRFGLGRNCIPLYQFVLHMTRRSTKPTRDLCTHSIRVFKNNINNFKWWLWGCSTSLGNMYFQRLIFSPSCFDQLPVRCCKMIFHSLLQSIMYGYFKISTAYPKISALLAIVSLQCIVASQKLQNATRCGCSRLFHPQRVSSQGESRPT